MVEEGFEHEELGLQGFILIHSIKRERDIIQLKINIDILNLSFIKD